MFYCVLCCTRESSARWILDVAYVYILNIYYILYNKYKDEKTIYQYKTTINNHNNLTRVCTILCVHAEFSHTVYNTGSVSSEPVLGYCLRKYLN